MYHLSRALAKDKAGGMPLGEVWETLSASTVVFRRGQLVLVGSGPGVGKSAFALTLAVQSGSKSIYFSADSGPGTQLSRTAAIKLGKETEEITKEIEQGNLFETELVELKRIRWDFDAGPTLDSINESVDAYAYLHGEYPELIIVDNLMDVVADVNGDDSSGTFSMQAILQFLKELARNTGAMVMVLHHLVGEFENGDTPPPLGALRGKVSKVPEQVLNLYRIESVMGPEALGVVIAKNRGGKANAAGKMHVELAMDLSRMVIKDHDQKAFAQAQMNQELEELAGFARAVDHMMGGHSG